MFCGRQGTGRWQPSVLQIAASLYNSRTLHEHWGPSCSISCAFLSTVPSWHSLCRSAWMLFMICRVTACSFCDMILWPYWLAWSPLVAGKFYLYVEASCGFLARFANYYEKLVMVPYSNAVDFQMHMISIHFQKAQISPPGSLLRILYWVKSSGLCKSLKVTKFMGALCALKI